MSMWIEEIHPGVMFCHMRRLRLRVWFMTFTLWTWEVD